MKVREIVVLFAMLTSGSVAFAYSNPASFELAASDGGGGGRFFTGSPADPYSCAACHSGPSRLDVVVNGLPDSYVPGVAYDIVLSWPRGTDEVSGTFEIVDGLGQPAGEVAVPSPADGIVAGLCNLGDAENPDYAQVNRVFEVPSRAGFTRQVVGVAGCEGATLAQFRWTAPEASVPAVHFVGGVVRALDEGNTPDNDQVTLIDRTIPSVFEPDVPVPSQEVGCHASAVGAGSLSPLPWLTAVLIWLRRRRRAG